MVGELLSPIIKKRFSKDEIDYYRNIRGGVDDCVLYALSWLKTHEAVSLSDVDDDDFDDEFKYTMLYDKLDEYTDINRVKGVSPISRFYKIGHRLAYNNLNVPTRFQENDVSALSILEDYVGNLVEDVNKDACLGIKDVLMTGFLAGYSFNKIGEMLLDVPNNAYASNSSIDFRCVMISNTEYARSINTGLLQGYSNEGVKYVYIKTYGDIDVCDDCLMIEENNPYSLSDAMELLPLHPNCRCSYEVDFDSIRTIDDFSSNFIVDLTNNG